MGLEGILNGNLGKYFNIYATINYTYGRILSDTVPYPLHHIPPVFGRLSLKYQKKKVSTEFFVIILVGSAFQITICLAKIIMQFHQMGCLVGIQSIEM